MLDEDRLVRRVRPFTDCAHAVERGNAERRGEVAVGSATGRGFVESESQLARESLRLAKKFDGSARAFHRRAVDAASDIDGAPRVRGLERSESALDARAIGTLVREQAVTILLTTPTFQNNRSTVSERPT